MATPAGTSPTTATMLGQVGWPTLGAVSGGRVRELAPGHVSLPVAHGYRVEVALDPMSDTYTVTRRWVRGVQSRVRGEVARVNAGELAEVVYRASLYRDPFGE